MYRIIVTILTGMRQPAWQTPYSVTGEITITVQKCPVCDGELKQTRLPKTITCETCDRIYKLVD